MKSKPICYVCNKPILSKSDLTIGRLHPRYFYKMFHTKHYNEFVNKGTSYKDFTKKWPEPFKRSERAIGIPIMRFFHRLGFLKLNSINHC